MDIDLGLATFKVDTILSAGISLIVALLTTIAFHFIESPRLEARREHYKAQFELAHELAAKLGNVAAVMQTIRDREATPSNHRSTISEKYVKTIEEMDPGNARMPSSRNTVRILRIYCDIYDWAKLTIDDCNGRKKQETVEWEAHQVIRIIYHLSNALHAPSSIVKRQWHFHRADWIRRHVIRQRFWRPSSITTERHARKRRKVRRPKTWE